MKLKPIQLGAVLGVGLAGLLLAGAAQAQQVRAAKQSVRIVSENADQARANLEASMRAAARGQKVGMLTGQVNPKPVVHADGSVSQELDAGTMSYTVARRSADGTIEMVCLDNAEAAHKALTAPAFAQRLSSKPAKEQRNVK